MCMICGNSTDWGMCCHGNHHKNSAVSDITHTELKCLENYFSIYRQPVLYMLHYVISVSAASVT